MVARPASLTLPRFSALPSLNQLMRGSFNLPFSSSSGLPSSSLRFTYQDTLRSGGVFGDPVHPNSSAMFTTSDLGNGVFLSAGTGYGIRSTAGAPAASLGQRKRAQAISVHRRQPQAVVLGPSPAQATGPFLTTRASVRTLKAGRRTPAFAARNPGKNAAIE